MSSFIKILYQHIFECTNFGENNPPRFNKPLARLSNFITDYSSVDKLEMVYL